jgi:hypothetical protein
MGGVLRRARGLYFKRLSEVEKPDSGPTGQRSALLSGSSPRFLITEMHGRLPLNLTPLLSIDYEKAHGGGFHEPQEPNSCGIANMLMHD